MTGHNISHKRRDKMYRAQRREGIMLAYPFEQKRLSKWSPPWIIQPKLDGERCRAIVDAAGSATLISSELNIISSVPHINQQIKEIGLHDVELDGELYTHGLSFSEIHSRVSRKVNIHDDYRDIEYHIFDIVNDTAQASRTAFLDYLPPKPNIKVVESKIVERLDDIMATYEAFIEDGYEGFILRNPHAPYIRRRSIYMMKFKPKKVDHYLIYGYKEERSIHNVPKGRLGALALKSPDIYKPGTFDVGSGFTAQQREDLWKRKEELVGKICEVKYQHLTEKGVPRFPVFISVLTPSEYVARYANKPRVS